MLLLFETAAGYALFKVLNKGKIDSTAVRLDQTPDHPCVCRRTTCMLTLLYVSRRTSHRTSTAWRRHSRLTSCPLPPTLSAPPAVACLSANRRQMLLPEPARCPGFAGVARARRCRPEASCISSAAHHFVVVCRNLQVVKLKAFSKFENTTEALAGAAALTDSKLSKGLKKFLKKNAAADELAVLDAKLGGLIKEKLGIQCIWRCGRLCGAPSD